MTKKFFKDNRGQVLYAVIVTVMFLGVLSMIAMGLTLQNYHAAQQKQAHIAEYYIVDAAAELLRNGEKPEQIKEKWDVSISEYSAAADADAADADVINYKIVCGTVTLFVGIKDAQFTSWEVSYHAAE